jgi:hypothetical protein
VRLQLQVPSNVQAGQGFQARIDMDARATNGDLMFTIVYDKARLAFSGWSEGDIPRVLGARMEVEEPSDGNIQIILRSRNGSVVTGLGSLIVLQFEPINSGTAAVTLQNLMTIDNGGAIASNIALPGGATVTIR